MPGNVPRVLLLIHDPKVRHIRPSVHRLPAPLRALEMNGAVRHRVSQAGGHARPDREHLAALKGGDDAHEQVLALLDVGKVGDPTGA